MYICIYIYNHIIHPNRKSLEWRFLSFTPRQDSFQWRLHIQIWVRSPSASFWHPNRSLDQLPQLSAYGTTTISANQSPPATTATRTRTKNMTWLGGPPGPATANKKGQNSKRESPLLYYSAMTTPGLSPARPLFFWRFNFWISRFTSVITNLHPQKMVQRMATEPQKHNASERSASIKVLSDKLQHVLPLKHRCWSPKACCRKMPLLWEKTSELKTDDVRLGVHFPDCSFLLQA